RHHLDEPDRGHPRDERLVLGHVADEGADLPGARRDVEPEDARGPRGGRMETQQGVDERRLPGAVRPQQADRAAGQAGLETVEDRPPAEPDRQPIESDDWLLRSHGMYYEIPAPMVSTTCGRPLSSGPKDWRRCVALAATAGALRSEVKEEGRAKPG